jgi:hypothetical protein
MSPVAGPQSPVAAVLFLKEFHSRQNARVGEPCEYRSARTGDWRLATGNLSKEFCYRTNIPFGNFSFYR